jgi:hypothetical protein
MKKIEEWIIEGNRLEFVMFSVITVAFFCVMFYACGQMSKA